MRITVLGASGGIGGAITAELHGRGHALTAVNRRGDAAVPAGVRRVAADLYDQQAATRACASADVVVLAAQPPYADWFGSWERMMDAVLEATAAAGARLILVDNLYMYGAVDGPITEASPERATTAKGRLRAALGRRVLAAHEAGQVRATIGRFSDYYGPGGTNSLLYMLQLQPALAGRKMRAFIDADMPHTFHHLPDAARGFATLVEHESADGRVWILPAAAAPTQRELALVTAEQAGVPAQISRITPAMVRVGGLFSTQIRESRQVIEQYDRPWVVDASAFVTAFGPIELTPHEVAIATTIASFRAARAAAVAA
jgi:nucleoside-diphosphate-sugar epimerase